MMMFTIYTYRTSSQEGLSKVKAKAKVVIELLLSVQGCVSSLYLCGIVANLSTV